jgi:hypothetical protein
LLGKFRRILAQGSFGSCCCICTCSRNIQQVGSQDSNSAVSSSSGNNPSSGSIQWQVGNQKLEFSSNLGRVLEFSRLKDGRECVEFMSTLDPQVVHIAAIFTRISSAHQQASQGIISEMMTLYGDLARLEQQLLSNIPTATVVDELCEMA